MRAEVCLVGVACAALPGKPAGKMKCSSASQGLWKMRSGTGRCWNLREMLELGKREAVGEPGRFQLWGEHMKHKRGTYGDVSYLVVSFYRAGGQHNLHSCSLHRQQSELAVALGTEDDEGRPFGAFSQTCAVASCHLPPSRCLLRKLSRSKI